MKRRAFWAVLVVIVIAALVWRWRGGSDERVRGEPVTRAAVVRAEPANLDPPRPIPVATASGERAPAERGADPTTSRPSAVPRTAPAAPPSAPSPAAAGRPAIPPAAAAPTSAEPDHGAAGGLVDRTGWGDPSLAKQLNREFMPLASECIDQAKARDRRLHGRLMFGMVLAPTGDGKAIVASLKLRPDNEIHDAELIECIRESSFALEGLTAPRDFDITIPIDPESSGR